MTSPAGKLCQTFSSSGLTGFPYLLKTCVDDVNNPLAPGPGKTPNTLDCVLGNYVSSPMLCKHMLLALLNPFQPLTHRVAVACSGI